MKYFYYCTFFVKNQIGGSGTTASDDNTTEKDPVPLPLMTTQPKNVITHIPTDSESDPCDGNALRIDASDDRGIWVIHKLSL
jgi:hypothetical protein